MFLLVIDVEFDVDRCGDANQAKREGGGDGARKRMARG